MTWDPSRSIDRSCHVYAALITIFPSEFRREYGAPMVQVFRDVCAAGARDAGAPGLAGAWLCCLADLLGGASHEWLETIAGWARERGRVRLSSLSAAGAALTAAALVLYSQTRYPANLARPDYAAFYAGLLVVLGLLAVVFVSSRAATPVAIACGPAIAAVVLANIAGRLPDVAALAITVALVSAPGFGESARAGTVVAGLRSSVVVGALTGIVLLMVNVAGGLVAMGSLAHDATYLHEFAGSGQSDVAAYVVGELIGGGVFALLVGTVAAAVIGAAAAAAGRCLWRYRTSRAS